MKSINKLLHLELGISIITLLLVTSSFTSFATQQERDYIIYKGDTHALNMFGSSLLKSYYYENRAKKYPFKFNRTSNYRGHVATWEIKNNSLYLVNIDVNHRSKKLKQYFKNDVVEKRVLAKWYSGIIYLSLEAISSTYFLPDNLEPLQHPQYKKQVSIEIENGIVKSEIIKDLTLANTQEIAKIKANYIRKRDSSYHSQGKRI